MLERTQIVLGLGLKALEIIEDECSRTGEVRMDFPDYEIKLRFDSKVPVDKVIHLHEGRRLETQQMMNYSLPSGNMPEDVTRIVRLGFAEAVRCYENSCFLACIAMCGRTIETVLGALYEKTLGIHPVNDPQKPGFSAILNRLKKEGYTFPPGLKEKMDVIGLHRNMAVHGNLIFPTEDEARSVVYSTKDVLKVANQ